MRAVWWTIEARQEGKAVGAVTKVKEGKQWKRLWWTMSAKQMEKIEDKRQLKIFSSTKSRDNFFIPRTNIKRINIKLNNYVFFLSIYI